MNYGNASPLVDCNGSSRSITSTSDTTKVAGDFEMAQRRSGLTVAVVLAGLTETNRCTANYKTIFHEVPTLLNPGDVLSNTPAHVLPGRCNMELIVLHLIRRLLPTIAILLVILRITLKLYIYVLITLDNVWTPLVDVVIDSRRLYVCLFVGGLRVG